ncbi:MAG: oligopeptidase B, partial [Bacteroidetes bacterium]
MKNYLSGSLLFIASLLIFSGCTDTKSTMKPPVAKKIDKELIAHDQTRIDPYYWLNDREDQEVITYLENENAYTKAMMEHTEELQTELYDEIIGRIQQTDMSVPYKRNGYFYYSRYEEGMEYPIYCRKKGMLEAEEEIMLNVNEMAEGYSYFQVGGVSVSPDNKIVAYGVDTVSRRKYTIYFKNLETGEIFSDAIPNTTGYAPWAADNKTLFYTRKDEVTLRPDKIYRHVLGEDASGDPMIFHEEDETFRTMVTISKSMDYLMIGSFSTLSTEYRYLDASTPEEEFKVFQERKADLEYFVSHYQDKFYVRTNLDAKNFRLMETPVGKTNLESWKEVIAHRPEVLLEDYEVFNKYLALQERTNGLTEIRIMS